MADVVSERYALSLYEVGQDQGKTEQYLEEMNAVCDAMRAEPDFIKVLSTPSIPFADKQQVLQTVFGGRVDPYVLNFLCLITEKERIRLLYDMLDAYRAQYYQENGIVEVTAITAVPLSQPLSDKLTEKMSAVTGKKVVLKKQVDPDLLGGIVVKVDNKQFDTSLRAKLDELAQQMTKIIA